MRAARLIYAVESVRYARILQAIFRGNRSRTMGKMTRRGTAQQGKQQRRAATRLQSSFRGWLARRSAKRRRDELYDDAVSAAKRWTKVFSRDEGIFVFVNSETGQVLEAAAPPDCGFVDEAGNIVLDGGETVIENPLHKMSDEDRLIHATDKLCSECESAEASRKCDQCGDRFCAKCWSVVHAFGKRRDHSYAPVGDKPECSECEAKFADRWCVSCDDFFCNFDFDRLHIGNKAQHVSKPCGAAMLQRLSAAPSG